MPWQRRTLTFGHSWTECELLRLLSWNLLDPSRSPYFTNSQPEDLRVSQEADWDLGAFKTVFINRNAFRMGAWEMQHEICFGLTLSLMDAFCLLSMTWDCLVRWGWGRFNLSITYTTAAQGTINVMQYLQMISWRRYLVAYRVAPWIHLATPAKARRRGEEGLSCWSPFYHRSADASHYPPLCVISYTREYDVGYCYKVGQAFLVKEIHSGSPRIPGRVRQIHVYFQLEQQTWLDRGGTTGT